MHRNFGCYGCVLKGYEKNSNAYNLHSAKWMGAEMWIISKTNIVLTRRKCSFNPNESIGAYTSPKEGYHCCTDSGINDIIQSVHLRI